MTHGATEILEGFFSFDKILAEKSLPISLSILHMDCFQIKAMGPMSKRKSSKLFSIYIIFESSAFEKRKIQEFVGDDGDYYDDDEKGPSTMSS